MLYRKVLKLSVISGPSKMDLVTALAYAFDRRTPHYVWFDTVVHDPKNHDQQELAEHVNYYNVKGRLAVQIVSLGNEDGSGESFIFTGNILRRQNGCSGKADYVTIWPVEGYFSTRDRKGHIQVSITLADDK